MVKKVNKDKKRTNKRVLSKSKGRTSTTTKKSVRRGGKIGGLKKWNKVLSLLVKHYKKSDIPYNISEARKEASSVYQSIKSTPYSRISKKQVVSQSTGKPKLSPKVQILPSEVDAAKWFYPEIDWWNIGKHLYDFNQTYPDIPIMAASPTNTLPLMIGEIDTYEGSVLQEYVERLREEFENGSDLTFTGQTAYDKKGKRQYAFWGTEDIMPPDVVEQIEKIPPKKRKEIKRRKKIAEERIKKETKDIEELKKKKRKLPAIERKKEKISDTKAEQLTKQMEILERAFDKCVYDKTEYKQELKELMGKYDKGGII